MVVLGGGAVSYERGTHALSAVRAGDAEALLGLVLLVVDEHEHLGGAG